MHKYNRKKNNNFLNVIIVILSIMIIICTLSIYKDIYTSLVVVNSKDSYIDIKNIENEIDTIPQWITEYFYDNGQGIYFFYLKNDDIMKGYFNRENKNIYIGITEETYYKNTVIHEMGHYLDIVIYNEISKNHSFKKIYQEEKENFINIDYRNLEYYIFSEKEFFAGSFEIYLQDSQSLKKYCPKTYAFLESITY
ncbi:MAG: anthrax toxin lethal factor-related metalloendopeptidase [Anaerotignaceae bacterium]